MATTEGAHEDVLHRHRPDTSRINAVPSPSKDGAEREAYIHDRKSLSSNPSFITMSRKVQASSLFLCRAQEVKNWLKEVFNTKIGSEGEEKPLDVVEHIHNGTVLCELANKMVPGSIPSFHRNKKAAFFMMENIQLFLNFCQEKGGIAESDLFSTPDLYEGKNLPLVINSLLLLEQTAGSKWNFMPRLKPIDIEKSNFSDEEMKKAEFSLKTAKNAAKEAPVQPPIEATEETDQLMSQFIEREEKEAKGLKIKKISQGIYMFGHIKVLIKSVNGHIAVRVGGGWMRLDEFLDKHNTVLDVTETQEQADRLDESRIDQWRTVDTSSNHLHPVRPSSSNGKEEKEVKDSPVKSSGSLAQKAKSKVTNQVTDSKVSSPKRPVSASVKTSEKPPLTTKPAARPVSAPSGVKTPAKSPAPKSAVSTPRLSTKTSTPAPKVSRPATKLAASAPKVSRPPAKLAAVKATTSAAKSPSKNSAPVKKVQSNDTNLAPSKEEKVENVDASSKDVPASTTKPVVPKVKQSSVPSKTSKAPTPRVSTAPAKKAASPAPKKASAAAPKAALRVFAGNRSTAATVLDKK